LRFGVDPEVVICNVRRNVAPEVELYGYPPNQPIKNPLGQVSAWSTFLENGRHLVTDFNFEVDVAGDIGAEHAVRHANVIGALEFSAPDRYSKNFEGTVTSLDPFSVQMHRQEGGSYIFPFLDSRIPDGPWFNNTIDGVEYRYYDCEREDYGFSYRLLAIWSASVTNPYTGQSEVQQRCESRYRRVKIKMKECQLCDVGDVLRPSDLVEVESFWLYEMYNAGPGKFLGGNYGGSRDELIAFWRDFTDGWRIPLKDDVPDGMIAYAQSTGAYFPDAVSLYFLSYLDPGKGLYAMAGFAPGRGYYQSNEHSFLNFLGTATPLLRESIAGIVLSQFSAIDNAVDAFKANHIEAALEFEQLFSVLSVVKDLRDLLHGRIHSQSLVRDIVAFLTSARLCWSYGLAPTLDDVIDVAKKASRLYRRYFSSHREIELGRAMKSLSHSSNGFDLEISCRTRLEFRIDYDSLLPWLLPVHQLGFLPSLSNFWDVVPFSFVADMFLPIGGGLDAIDKSVLYFGMDVVSATHSITVDAPVSSFCGDFNLTPVSDPRFRAPDGSSITPRYRLYERMVTGSLLYPVPTALPWYGGAGVPDWVTFGSLIIQTIIL